jgi:hypothetical protein
MESRPGRPDIVSACMSEATEQFRYEVSETIRTLALSLPETTEGTSCVNRAFKAGSKNFAFVGEKDEGCGLRLKLDASVPDIEKRSMSRPDRYEVGKGGWVMMRFAPDDPPAMKDLETWIVESFRLLAPKSISATLDVNRP